MQCGTKNLCKINKQIQRKSCVGRVSDETVTITVRQQTAMTHCTRGCNFSDINFARFHAEFSGHQRIVQLVAISHEFTDHDPCIVRQILTFQTSK